MMRLPIRNIAIVFILIATLFISCKNKELFFEFKDIPKSGWSNDSSISFQLDSTLYLSEKRKLKTKSYIEIIHSSSYPYQDIQLLIICSVNDSIISVDSINTNTVDAKGHWIGKGIAANRSLSIEHNIPVNLSNLEEETYTVYIYHLMTDSILTGLKSIGLKIEGKTD